MVPARLTYCGNVHPAMELDAWLADVHQHAWPVATAARSRGRAFGLGAWWHSGLAARLAGDGSARDRVARALDELGIELWTLNVFPHGAFHADVVKEAVYAPDWAHEDRLAYTRACAEAGALLAPRGAVLPLSTLPLGYRGPGEEPADLRVMARNLARAASMLAAVEERTGVRCVLALEPEPFCLLETVAQAARFLEDWVFEEGAWVTVPQDVLRRHLGVCVDLCHLFVVGEDPLAALADLRARRIEVPKVQVSSCLEVREPAGLEALLAFDEPRWLHQTVAVDGTRALDLQEVRARQAAFRSGGRVRTHFHVPLYWDLDGPFGSTRREVVRFLQGLTAPLPLLEVETYTWPVLGGLGFAEPLSARLVRELDFAAGQMPCADDGSSPVASTSP